MHVCIEDPRRAPRVPVQLKAGLSVGSASWEAVTLDLSPGGCHLVSDRFLPVGTELSLSFRAEVLPRLRVTGSVRWALRSRYGVAFRQDEDARSADRWFRRLLELQPQLALAVQRRRPRRVPMDACLTRRGNVAVTVALSPAERRVVALVTDRTPLRAVALMSGLNPGCFAQSLFSLIEKGVIGSDVSLPVKTTREAA